MGARVLGRSDSEVRFVNVRRLLMLIAESIDERIQWAVFEPNNRALWREIDRVVRAFLDGLWRAGMLDGATAAQAYSVRCDAATNPPESRDQGLVVCEIGVLPPWPAEFVVVRIGKTADSTSISEGREGLP
jgi:phage tail sheath protein FI